MGETTNRAQTVSHGQRVRRRARAGALVVALALLVAARGASAMCCYCYQCAGAFCTENPVDSVGCAQLCTNAGCPALQYFVNDDCSNGCGFFDTVKKERCQTAKLKAAGKYAYCRLKEARKAVLTGRPADYSRCDDRLIGAFQSAETASSEICASEGDAATMQTFIGLLTDKVDAALAGNGGPSCP